MQALDAGTASVLPEGLRAELEQLEDAGGVRHLQDLKEQVQASFLLCNHISAFSFSVLLRRGKYAAVLLVKGVP